MNPETPAEKQKRLLMVKLLLATRKIPQMTPPVPIVPKQGSQGERG